MNISPIHCPDTSCPWAAFGVPDAYTEARAWHLAVHRAEEHDEPLTAEQVAYAMRVGHVLPSCMSTATGAPASVGDQPRPLDDQRLAEALAAYEGHPDLGFACCTAHAVADHVLALLAELAAVRAERDQAQAAVQRGLDALRVWRDEREAGSEAARLLYEVGAALTDEHPATPNPTAEEAS